jgi:hypothetical protein
MVATTPSGQSYFLCLHCSLLWLPPATQLALPTVMVLWKHQSYLMSKKSPSSAPKTHLIGPTPAYVLATSASIHMDNVVDYFRSQSGIRSHTWTNLARSSCGFWASLQVFALGVVLTKAPCGAWNAFNHPCTVTNACWRTICGAHCTESRWVLYLRNSEACDNHL